MERTRWMGERGSALPLLAIVLGGVALALSLVMVQGQHQARVAQAQWAADAAARAAAAEVVPDAAGGGLEAQRAATVVAEANGARLVSIEVVERPERPGQTSSQAGIRESAPISPTVAVQVDLGGIRAWAAAARFAVEVP